MHTTFNLSKNDWIKWSITVILALLFFLIPESNFYTPQVKMFFVITVFSLAIMAFEFMPPLIMAVLLPVLWVIFGVCNFATAVAPWTSSTMYMAIGILVFTGILDDCGILKRLAFYLMSKINGSYCLLLLGLMFVGFLLGVVTLGSGYAIMAALCAGLIYGLKIEKRKEAAGIAMAGMLGACSSHAYTYSAQSIALIKGSSSGLIDELVITPISVFIHNWPMAVVCVVILLITMKWYKPETAFNSGDYFKDQLAALGPITHREKVNAIMIFLVLVYICTANIHKLDMSYAFAVIPYVVFLPFINGADEKTMKKVNWQMMFFCEACMAIGTVATALGLGDTLASLCINLFSNTNSFTTMFAGLFGIVFLMNFLMTPMAIWSLLSYPVLSAASQLGFSLLPFVYALMTSSEAIILPYEFIPYLLFFSFGVMKMGDFVKLNIMRSIIYFAGYLFILIPYWHLIGVA